MALKKSLHPSANGVANTIMMKDYSPLKEALREFKRKYYEELLPIIDSVDSPDADSLFEDIEDAISFLGNNHVQDQDLMEPIRQIIPTLTLLKQIYTGKRYGEHALIDEAIDRVYDELYPALIKAEPELRAPFLI